MASFTLQSLLDKAKTSQMSAEGINNLRADILAGKFDAMAKNEGIDLEPFKNANGKKTVATPGFLTKGAASIEQQTTDSGLKEKAQNLQVGMTTDINSSKPVVNTDEQIRQETLKNLRPEVTGNKTIDALIGPISTPISQLIGGVKEVGKMAAGGASLFERASNTVMPEKLGTGSGGLFSPKGQTFGEKIMPSLESSNTTEKQGALVADLAAFVGGGEAASALTARSLSALEGTELGAKILSKLPGVTPTAISSLAQGAAATGVAGTQSGKIGKSELTTGAITAAFPWLSLGASKVLDPKSLMYKALGLTKSQQTTLNETLKGSEYEDLADFALKNKLIGGREDFVTQADDLFDAATSSKKELLQNVTETVPNNYDNAFQYLRNTYGVQGQENALARIEELAAKPQLSAVELDEVRQMIDFSMPAKAYTGMEPVKVQGIQNLVDPMRETLANLDKTGTLRSTNKEIQALYKLIPYLKNSTNSSVVRQLMFRNIGRALTLGPVALLTGGVPQGVAVAFGLADAATDIPIVSSYLAQLLSSGVKLPEFLTQLVKAALQETTQKVTS